MDFVSPFIDPIVDCLLDPVRRHMGYLFSSTEHVENMSAMMKILDGKSVDVKKSMDANIINNLEIPTRVPDWLKDVEKIKEDAQRISSIGYGCLNMKARYQAGRNASKITAKIESLINENKEMIWSDARIPLGKVNSKNTSTSTPLGGDAQNHFKSRENAFRDALNCLQQDHNSQVIALCGMGGVGKTTMMEQLKKTVEDKQMFDWIVQVVVGQKINMLSIQQTVAEYIGQPLTETSKTARADRLRKRFGGMSEGKRKVLVILDDVWEAIELKDLGLSPLPNGFKLLLTSRYDLICTQIAVEANLILKRVHVDVMEEQEAHSFFDQITEVSKQHDMELNQIGSEIVKRCGFLPLAIKLIATTLKFQEKFVWRNTLHRLKVNDLDKNVQEIVEISYTYIKEEEVKAIFLLCGLFPDDYNIPIEELTRYAWGLQLLNGISTLGDARDRTKTCVQNLKSANLLMDSHYHGCIKMHDLVLAYVLGRVSKGDHPWIINHADISKPTRARMSESCERISITCAGMSEFPRDFKYPNVSLLRLMHGDRSLGFPEDFYERMKNLQVVAYEKMQYPLLPRSLEGSTKLRTLLLHQCSLMFDCSAIGELLNLEVLSFAHCHIRKLPSTIRNLKNLKLLDLTGCVNLRIEDGVLRSLVSLEELYMRVFHEKAIRFTDGNLAELAELSEHLSAIEIEFFDNNGKPKNMVFTKVERFRISIGRSLGDNTELEMHSFENTLMLITNKDELLESRVNELFQKSEVLYLEVEDMNDLEEVIVKSVHPHHHLFYNLRVLNVVKCANLKYLFTVPMASGLMKLERLTVSQCPVMKVVAYRENEGDGVIMFQGLKFLYLDNLPKLVGFSNTVNVIELPELVELSLLDLHNFTCIYPENSSTTSSTSSGISSIQPLFNKEVLIPKLEILNISSMNKLKEIWPYQFNSTDAVEACMLRAINVASCDNIVNLFPTNPMSLLRHLEVLSVLSCGSIQVLFNIDMTRVGEIEEHSSKLRYIFMYNLGKLRELWRMNGESSSAGILIRNFQAVETIEIVQCRRFVNVFAPTITNSDVTTLMKVSIDGRRHWEESARNNELVQKREEINFISKEGIPTVYDSIHDISFPLHRLKHLSITSSCKDVEVAFEIESSGSRDLTTTQHNQQAIRLPHLNDLGLDGMERMSHVWKCNWNKLVIPQNQSESSFHNLTSISVTNCHSIQYLFSPLMGKLLPNLKEVDISSCSGIKEVVSNRYDEDDETDTHTNTMSFPHLEYLKLTYLPHLKIIDGGNANEITPNTSSSIHDQFKGCEVGVASWFLCQHSKKIEIVECDDLSTVFPAGQLHKLEELRILQCKSMVEVFEVENNDGVHITNVGDDTCTTITIPRSQNMTLLELPNLMILDIHNCELLEHIFTSSTLDSLKQLKDLTIRNCKAIQVIVKLEAGDQLIDTSKVIVFPCLKSITLADLPNLKGFFLGMNDFEWTALENVEMYGCPQMMSFTSGHSNTRKLKYIHTGLGKHSLECGLDFHFSNVMHETSDPDMIKRLQFPWSFSNLVEVNNTRLLTKRIMFPCKELINLKNLEKIYIHYPIACEIEEVFEGANGDVNETQPVVVFPKLKEVALHHIITLQHLWKSNRWMVLSFPKLTKVSIAYCPLLGHVFAGCIVGSLMQLQELKISECQNMDMIVKQVEEGSKTRATEVEFPCLKSITLDNLPNLKGFCLGNEAFLFRSLHTLEIKDCPQITVFTNGKSTTPELKLIDTTFGLCHAMEDPNSFIKTKQQEGWQF